MIIVIDTNIWLAELGLNSHAGTALRFFMRQQKARLAVPEVVRLEVQRHIRADLHERRSEIERNYRSMLAHFGQLKQLVLPTTAEIDAKVAGHFDSLGVEILEVPFSLESARASFLKTIDKVPPSDKNQQFKDGVIWADCVKLLDLDEVALVGADKAFFRDRKYELGLARALAAETLGRPHQLVLHPDLGGLLKSIQTALVLGEEELAAALVAASGGSMERLAERNGFAMGRLISATSRLFITEQTDTLFVECEVEYECLDVSTEGRTDARVRQSATGMYDQSGRVFNELAIASEELRCTVANGTEQSWRNSYMRGVAALGHRTVRHMVRHPIT